MTNNGQLLKGPAAEESLRSYFNSIGYFSVRGVPFEYSGFMLTDVDLWLYLKESSIARTRINVDVKRKKTPQAMERIFWTKGLQEVLGLDSCIVATTDKRSETIQFGRAHDVTVLDGQFMQRVLSYGPDKDNRITEENFEALLDKKSLIESSINFRNEYRVVKKLLLSELNFNGCNIFLEKQKLLFLEYQLDSTTRESALRLLYVVISYFLVSLDFVSRNFSYREVEERSKEIHEGFTYGESGKKRVDEITRIAISLVEQSTSGDLFVKNNLKSEIDRQLNDYPSDLLVDHFSKSDNLKYLFSDAKQFEALGFAKHLVFPMGLEVRQKALIAVFCDFFKVDRKKII
jgi:hypothetical protein